MIVDCDRCVVRGVACQECVITVLFGAPPEGVALEGPGQSARGVMVGVGPLPHLQLVHRRPDVDIATGGIGMSDPLGSDVERSAADGERSRRQVS
jgi:hypothetical protein